MKTTFREFILSNPNCKKFEGNEDAIRIFDFLSEDASIIKMIDACEQGKPALAPVVKELEEMLETMPHASISFEDHFTKQTAGVMVRSILEPFGYRVSGQKAMPKESGAKRFKSASCYIFDSEMPVSMRVVKKIESI